MLESTLTYVSGFIILQSLAAVGWILKLVNRIAVLETHVRDIDKTAIVDDLKVKVAQLETKSQGNDLILMEIKASLIRIENRLNNHQSENQ